MAKAKWLMALLLVVSVVLVPLVGGLALAQGKGKGLSGQPSGW